MRQAIGFAACVGLLLLPQSAAAQQGLPAAPPESVGFSSQGLARATSLLRESVDQGLVAGAVAAVARRGRVVYLEAVGSADIASGAPMTARSLFRIYSMTKPVTAVAAMMLWEEGRFQLDDPVARYLPEFGDVFVAEGDGATRPPARPITVQDLFLHTSGLNHRTSRLYSDLGVRSRSDPLDRFITKIVRAPLMEDPGTRYRYSEGTTVLGRLIEVWSGQPLDVFMEQRIFHPLGMHDTGFWVPPEWRDRLTTVYQRSGDGLTPIEIEDVPFTERPALLEGAVGLVSTVPDYLRFAQMLLNGGELDGVRLLRPETVARMTANGLPDPVLAARGRGTMGWGLANVNVVLDPAAVNYPANVGEYGWDGSAGTIFWVDPAEEMVIVLMTQSQPANPGSLRQRFKTLIHEALVPSR